MKPRTLRLSIILVFVALLGGCAAQQEERIQPRRLIVMSAMKSEMAALRSRAEIAETRVINGRSYCVGRLAGKDVILVLSGISMVNKHLLRT